MKLPNKNRILYLGILISAIALFGFFAGTQKSYSFSEAKFDIEEMALNAAVIIEGAVILLSSDWNLDSTLIYTELVISIDSIIKGDLADSTQLELEIVGGIVDSIQFEILESAVFVENEEILIFLDDDYSTPFPIFGMDQGKFTRVIDSISLEIRYINPYYDLSREDILQRILDGLAEM